MMRRRRREGERGTQTAGEASKAAPSSHDAPTLTAADVVLPEACRGKEREGVWAKGLAIRATASVLLLAKRRVSASLRAFSSFWKPAHMLTCNALCPCDLRLVTLALSCNTHAHARSSPHLHKATGRAAHTKQARELHNPSLARHQLQKRASSFS